MLLASSFTRFSSVVLYYQYFQRVIVIIFNFLPSTSFLSVSVTFNQTPAAHQVLQKSCLIPDFFFAPSLSFNTGNGFPMFKVILHGSLDTTVYWFSFYCTSFLLSSFIFCICHCIISSNFRHWNVLALLSETILDKFIFWHHFHWDRKLNMFLMIYWKNSVLLYRICDSTPRTQLPTALSLI